MIGFPESSGDYSGLRNSITHVVAKLAELCDAIQPRGVNSLTHPRMEKDWQGVSVVLKFLAKRPDGASEGLTSGE